MQFLLPTQQTERIYQADQPEIMVAVQVRDEDMGYAAATDLIIDHLYLGAFTTINQEIETTQGYDLAGGMTIKCRYGGVISKDGNCEHKLKYELCSLWQKVTVN